MTTASAPPPGPSDTGDWADFEEMAAAADALFFAMRRARAATASSAGPDLSLSQMTLLEPLLGTTQVPVGRLASLAAVSVPTATRMLKQLESRGMVDRRRSGADDRVVLVSLTGQGHDVLTVLRQRMRARQAASFAQFTLDERTMLGAQMLRLAAIIADMDD